MKKTFSKVAIVIFVILFLSSVAFALNKPIEYSPKGVTPKNYKKLPINEITFKWPKMKKAKFYAIGIEEIDLNNNNLSDILFIFTNKNKVDIHNDNFGSAIILKREPQEPTSLLADKKDLIGFFKKGGKYRWGVAGLDSKITLQPEYKQEEIEDLFQTLVEQHTVGQFKKPFYFFTEPKAFLGTLLTPVSDELLKEVPEIIKNQLKSGEGEMVINFSDIAQSPIIKNSPAEKAGLMAGDVILEIDGIQINKNLRVIDVLDLKSPGDVVNVKIWRAEIDTENAEKITSKIFYKKIKLTKRLYKDPQY